MYEKKNMNNDLEIEITCYIENRIYGLRENTWQKNLVIMIQIRL